LYDLMDPITHRPPAHGLSIRGAVNGPMHLGRTRCWFLGTHHLCTLLDRVTEGVVAFLVHRQISAEVDLMRHCVREHGAHLVELLHERCAHA
jgi:hypothetical protein